MSTSQLFGASGATAVTASDSADFVPATGQCARGLLVKTAGDYKITMESGADITCNLVAGIIHPIRCRRVWSTGAASISGIVAFF